MKKFVKVLAVSMALALSASVFAACGSSSSSKADSSKADSGKAESSAASKADESSKSADVDYNNPTVTFGEGDFEAYSTYVKEMQSNGHLGEVVKVTGIHSRSSFGAQATVSISDGGSKKIGTTYKLDGADKIDAYPANDATITVTGVVTLEDSVLGCYLAVPADKVN